MQASRSDSATFDKNAKAESFLFTSPLRIKDGNLSKRQQELHIRLTSMQKKRQLFSTHHKGQSEFNQPYHQMTPPVPRTLTIFQSAIHIRLSVASNVKRHYRTLSAI
ncbi:hypothetical protein Ancab_039987 [Ancistrocladus abbreviatus]